MINQEEVPPNLRRVIITDTNHVHPFNEPARDLRVLNKPLWLHQRDELGVYTTEEREYPDWDFAQRLEGKDKVPVLAHRDNIFFNKALIEEFLQRAIKGKKPVRLAFRLDDPAVKEHILPLAHSFQKRNGLAMAEMWYLPNGISESVIAEPLVIDTESRELGYYHVPPYMSQEERSGDLIYYLPKKAFVSLESWVHVFIIDILFGVFARGSIAEADAESNWRFKLKILSKAILEQKQVLDCSELVKVGNNVSIDPTAIIHGFTTIGNNVTISAGAVIDNCIIGNNVNVSQGCNLMLSVVGDGCFLPFRASLFMTTLMERTMVAQNTCLQLCIVGRDSFIGAGSTFTDFNVVPAPLRAHSRLGLEKTDMIVLGGCVGHHCRLSSGLYIMPARTIESDVVLLAREDRSFIHKNVPYEESDFYNDPNSPDDPKYPYDRFYVRKDGI